MPLNPQFLSKSPAYRVENYRAYLGESSSELGPFGGCLDFRVSAGMGFLLTVGAELDPAFLFSLGDKEYQSHFIAAVNSS